MNKIIVLTLLVAGCTGTHPVVDASIADARGSCIPYANVVGNAMTTCDWLSWSCSPDVPSSSALDECRNRVLALEAAGTDTCEAVRTEVEGCH